MFIKKKNETKTKQNKTNSTIQFVHFDGSIRRNVYEVGCKYIYNVLKMVNERRLKNEKSVKIYVEHFKLYSGSHQKELTPNIDQSRKLQIIPIQIL